jgi:hypothetical protein
MEKAMQFSASNKDMFKELIKACTERGLYPKNKDLCSSIKSSISGMDIPEKEGIGGLVDAYLARVGQVPAPVEECQQSETTPAEISPVVAAPQPSHVSAPAPAPKGKPFAGITHGVATGSFLMLIHGAPGTGKTSLLAKARRVIIGDAERGSLKLSCARVVFRDWLHAVEFVRWFFSADNQEYDTLGIDTINALERMCHEQVCVENGWPDLDKPGYGKGFVKANLEMTKLIQFIRNASISSGKSVIFIGHSKVKSCPNPDGEDFERHCIGLHKDLLDWVYGQMDHVLFAHSKMVLKSADEKDKDSKKVAVGQNILQLHTGGAPNIISKNRCYPPLPRIIPMLPLNADAGTIEKFWKPF